MSCPTPLITPGNGIVASDGDGPQRRVEGRSNIFVIAALTSADGQGPVRIRNMSPTGALIEGAIIPPERSTVRLSRGSLSVAGEIVWRREHRAGVRLGSAINVAEWLPGGKTATGQQRVDEIVYSYKAEVADPIEDRATRLDIEKELLGLSASLNAIAEQLAGDHATIERHPNALQAIDVAAQTLEKTARQLTLNRGGRSST